MNTDNLDLKTVSNCKIARSILTYTFYIVSNVLGLRVTKHRSRRGRSM